MRKSIWLIFLLFCAIVIIPVNANSALIREAYHGDEVYSGRTSSDAVTVKIILLRDSDGTPVTGLTKSNFKLIKITDPGYCSPRDFIITLSGGNNGIYTMTLKPSSGTWLQSDSYAETFNFTFLVSKGSDYGVLQITLGAYWT